MSDTTTLMDEATTVAESVLDETEAIDSFIVEVSTAHRELQLASEAVKQEVALELARLVNKIKRAQDIKNKLDVVAQNVLASADAEESAVQDASTVEEAINSIKNSDEYKTLIGDVQFVNDSIDAINRPQSSTIDEAMSSLSSALVTTYNVDLALNIGDNLTSHVESLFNVGDRWEFDS